MSHPQITRALSFLSSLACAVEDYQSLMESGEGDDALLSRNTAADNIEGIRRQLLSLERSIGIEPAEVHALPVRVSDDWDAGEAA